MTEEQVKNGKHILDQLTQARNIKKALESDQSHFIIVLKNKRNFDTIVDFKGNTITQKFFPALEDYVDSYLHGLVDNEIKHLETELDAV